MVDLGLFWHRRDLRISDNVGLALAQQQCGRVVGVFCLDPNLLEREDVAPARVTYLIGSLQALQQRYQELGRQLLILQGEPAQVLPRLATTLGAEAVFWNLDVEPYAQSRDRAVRVALQTQGIRVSTHWDQLLHAPETVLTAGGKPYTVYTPFWRNWSAQPKPAPVPSLSPGASLSPGESALATTAGAIPLPSAADLGFHWPEPLVLVPGEPAAMQRLEQFCATALIEYQEQRNFPASPGTSQLSAALKFGVIGLRTVWAATVAVEANCRSDEARNSIQTWRQELAWREFYQHVMYFFPELAAGAYRSPLKNFPWQGNEADFRAWCAGQTGYPIVDAAMRQMNQTGWMHNRCRMIVASFLTKDLLVDWRWGEKYFMQKLIDGDLSANNGGWQWSASSGMDPKPLRIFNPASQAQKFDPEAEYIRQWLPELAGVDTAALVTGQISPLELVRTGYPAPRVDHRQQQQRFKQLYQAAQASAQ